MNTKDLLKISLSVIIIIVGGFIKIPLLFIPITLQVFAVLLISNLFNTRISVYSTFIYMLLGLIGIPVFSKGGGLWYVFEKSFGYILGFTLCSFLISFLKNKLGENFIIRLLINLIGVFSIYLIGIPYFYFIVNFVYTNHMSLNLVLYYGFIITLPSDLISILVVAIISPRIKNIIFYNLRN